MADHRRRNGESGLGKRLALALAMLLLAGFFLYQSMGRPAEKPVQAVTETVIAAPAEEEIPTAEEEEREAPSTPAPTMPEDTAEPAAPAAEETASPAPEEDGLSWPQEAHPIVYDERSFQLVTDMVYAFRKQVPDREEIIRRDVEALKEHDPSLGEAWGGIMDYWDYADNRLELNYEGLPSTLRQDESLCIVVLGFQLEPEGEMSPELLGRCELALKALEEYPRAYLAVTGGGTAYRNPEATEAGVMARWFLDRGVEESRIILEDRSSTTEENAKFTLKILTEQYPQIKSLVLVTSDYHVPLGCTLFTEAALLYACEEGRLPWRVDAHLALKGYGLAEYTDPAEQALYIWALANPQQN